MIICLLIIASVWNIFQQTVNQSFVAFNSIINSEFREGRDSREEKWGFCKWPKSYFSKKVSALNKEFGTEIDLRKSWHGEPYFCAIIITREYMATMTTIYIDNWSIPKTQNHK